MHGLRSALVAVCLIGMVGSSVVLVQTTPAPAATTEDAKNWSKKKWAEMKAKWAEEKEKWADCRKQSKDQKLKGKARLIFLKDCMTK
jgi:hypothetical protein